MVVGKPLFTVQQIQERVQDLGAQISQDYAGGEILVVALLRGAFIFVSDLVRTIQLPVTIDFITASSYADTESTGRVELHCDLREEVGGRDVLLVDDIADTGITLNFVREHILSRNPKSVKTCVFLDKKERRVQNVALDYVGFEIPDHYVVGYGLDYDNRYRNLPYIAIFIKNL